MKDKGKRIIKDIKATNPTVEMKLLVGLLLFISILIIAFVFSMVNSSDIKDSVKQLESDYKWEKIELLIESNVLSAQKNLEITTEDITRRLNKEYEGRMEELKEQLEDPSEDTEVSKIISDSIRYNYLNNLETDSHSQIVLSNDKILADNSLNHRDELTKRELTKEAELYENSTLAYRAYKAVSDRNHKGPIFLDKGTDSKIEHMTMGELEKVYKEHGMTALEDIYFLIPGYITERGDIFGVNDYNNIGVKQSNNKIIVLQRFNIFDTVENAYVMKHFDIEETSEIISYIDNKQTQNIAILSFVILLASVISFVMFFSIKRDIKMVEHDKFVSYPRSLDEYLDYINKNSK